MQAQSMQEPPVNQARLLQRAPDDWIGAASDP